MEKRYLIGAGALLLIFLWWRKKKVAEIIPPTGLPPGAPDRAPGGFLPPVKEMAIRTGAPPPTGTTLAPEPVPFPEITEQGIVERPLFDPSGIPYDTPGYPSQDYITGGAPPPPPPPAGGPPPPLPPPPGVPPNGYVDAWQDESGKQYEIPGDDSMIDEPFPRVDAPDSPDGLGWLRRRRR